MIWRNQNDARISHNVLSLFTFRYAIDSHFWPVNYHNIILIAYTHSVSRSLPLLLLHCFLLFLLLRLISLFLLDFSDKLAVAGRQWMFSQSTHTSNTFVCACTHIAPYATIYRTKWHATGYWHQFICLSYRAIRAESITIVSWRAWRRRKKAKWKFQSIDNKRSS